MASTQLAQRVEAVRRFNRFYTRQIGVLKEGLLNSPFSLTEARVLFELAHREDPTATQVGRALGLDAGYLSRILRSFQTRGLVDKRPSEEDRRRQILELTELGEDAFARLNAASRSEIEELLEDYPEEDQLVLTGSMDAIETVLRSPPRGHRLPYILRPHQSGDLGWVVHRHGDVYHREYGWGERFEALVARIVADFVAEFDPVLDRCWIAEREGEIVGSVFLVHDVEEEGLARLRLLLVEPAARGLGIGKRLVGECTQFARQAGYHTITLWTNSVLDAARHLYEVEGYELVREEPHDRFGKDLVGQNWELKL